MFQDEAVSGLTLNLDQEKQLLREVTCLERQLERLRRFDGVIDENTFATYRDMIEARYQQLESFGWSPSSKINYSSYTG